MKMCEDLSNLATSRIKFEFRPPHSPLSVLTMMTAVFRTSRTSVRGWVKSPTWCSTSARTLFMSEAYLHRVFPAMRSAFPSEWTETVKKAQKMNATWNIPGHGFVDDAQSLKAELDVYRKALEYVFTESKRLHDAKVPCEVPQAAAGGGGGGGGRGAGRGEGRGAAAAPAPCEAAQKANWGPYADWTLRSGQAQTAILKVYEELDGKLPPKPKS